MRLASSVVLTLAMLGTTACDDPGVVPDPGSDSGAEQDAAVSEPDAGVPLADAGTPPTDSGPDAAMALDAGPPPSEEFVALYENVLMRACGGGTCHGPGTNDSAYFGVTAALQMPDPTTARAVLVDQPTECRFTDDGRIRVVPFDPEASAIMIAGMDGLCGRRHGGAVSNLTAEDLVMMESWIAGGAL